MDNLYRQNAAIVAFNKDKKVLVFERIKGDKDTLWQFPQGGIEEGETATEAALRELFEETGIKSAKVIKTLDYGIKYDFPEDTLARFKAMGRDIVGQEQFWTLVYFYGDESEINLQNSEKMELKSYQWVGLDQPPKIAWGPKQAAYTIVMKEFTPLILGYEI